MDVATQFVLIFFMLIEIRILVYIPLGWQEIPVQYNWAPGRLLGVTQESKRMMSCLEKEGEAVIFSVLAWESMFSLSKPEATLEIQQPPVSVPGTSHGSSCWGWDTGTQGLPLLCVP